eukprot:TRINITY_DN14826_c0_g2_i1.p1 TRINITY_DN14826_c0_g2~~TRINITY_DN14826_c0_g2_i1.p1  ORF type:complete len:1280 (+),score=208.27 TRINITY_DN14826_c0_g2_i1:80-3841(+)
MPAQVHPAPQPGQKILAPAVHAELKKLRQEALDLLAAVPSRQSPSPQREPPQPAPLSPQRGAPPLSPQRGAWGGSPGARQRESDPASPSLGSPLSASACNPLLPSPVSLSRKGAATAAASAALFPCEATTEGGRQTSVTSRLGDGLEAGSYAGKEERVGALHDLMAERTLHRGDYPRAGERVPELLEWVIALPGEFNREFSAEERADLGRMYNSRDPQPLQFHDEDIIQGASERLPCGGCTPRTALRECGIHGSKSIRSCSRASRCLHAGDTRGGATCLLDNFVRVLSRIIDALEGKQPALPPACITPELAAALEKIPPREAAEGIAAIIFYTYEIKAPTGAPSGPDGSRPTQLYRLLGCAMRNLGDPAASESLTEAQRALWRRVVVLLRPFHWRLDRILLALPHQPRVVYRGIDVRVSDRYTVGSLVLWPPVTSTSASMDVAWDFMSADASGTFFILLTLAVADIAPFSWLPGEEEWLLHGLSAHQVTDKMRSGLRAIIGTNHDLVCLIQVDRRVPRPPPDQMVRARALALRLQTLLFKNFLATYVPPAVAVGCTAEGVAGAVGSQPLLPMVHKWFASGSRTVLVVGDGGSGKTSTSLRLVYAAADEEDPVPHPPGCGQGYVPIYIPLPAVENLLAPGTGEGHAVQPLTDYIIASNNLSPEEVSEMKKLPVLFVLDGLEEVPEELSPLRGCGLLAAGGLNLAEWPLARVVLCIRNEILQQVHGCGRWHLTEHDVLPDGDLWCLHGFGSEQVRQFSAKVVHREMLCVAKAGALAEPEEVESVLQRSVKELRCASPPAELIRDLQSEARSLCAAGSDPAAAAEGAVERTPAGSACREAMEAATAEVLARVKSVDPGLLSSPFVLSMVVSAGQVLLTSAFEGAARNTVYSTWLAIEVRRRLPRAGELANRCPEFAAMTEAAKVDLVLRFCGALACSPAMIDVTPSLLIVAELHRFATVADLEGLGLCPLGEQHLAALLEAAPLRLESGAGAMLSFPHASVHDYFAADWVARLAAEAGAEQHPDVQRVAIVLPRSASLEAATQDRLGKGDNPLSRLRSRIRGVRLAQALFVFVFFLSIPIHAMGDNLWQDRCGTAGFGILLPQAFIPRRQRVGQRVKWHYVCCFVACGALALGRAVDLSLCGASRLDPNWEGLICWMYPVFGILHFIAGYMTFCGLAVEPQFLIAGLGRLNLYQWPSATYRKIMIGAGVCFSVFYVLNLAFYRMGPLALMNSICVTVFIAVMTYRMLRLPARVQRR